MGILLLDGKPVLTSSDGKLIEAPSGGSSEPAEEIEPGDITFYDYEGTVVAAWSLSELSSKTTLPDGPTHEGLTFQGWNWSLADLKTQNAKMNVGAMYTTTDGKTRIYIHLEDSRKSPRMGLGVNGTAVIDWGDGSTPNTLIGTSATIAIWTPVHKYSSGGDYIITITCTGTISILGQSNTDGGSYLLRYSITADRRNHAYLNSIRKIEIGDNIEFAAYAFAYCRSLQSINLPSSLAALKNYMFDNCVSLRFIVIPKDITVIMAYCFKENYSLKGCSLPKGIITFSNYAFRTCTTLNNLYFPNSITNINQSAFRGCACLSKIIIPVNFNSMDSYALSECPNLVEIIFQGSIASIPIYAFNSDYAAKLYDFSHCTVVPTLANTNAFASIMDDCEIRVPASLLDEWKAATNWSTYADHIVAAT